MAEVLANVISMISTKLFGIIFTRILHDYPLESESLTSFGAIRTKAANRFTMSSSHVSMGTSFRK